MQITLSRTYLCLWRVHRMWSCACYLSTRLSENQFRKMKNAACSNCSNQDFETKFEWRTFWKNKHQNHHQSHITKYFYAKLQSMENFRLWNQVCPKERMIKILTNWHSINTIFMCAIITSNSFIQFHLLWRITNSQCKFAPKLL